MPVIKIEEVRAGLVIHLNAEILRQLGGSRATTKKGHAVADLHYFLILAVDDVNNECTAMPLFTEPGKDRELLKHNLKGGHRENWIGEHSYLFRWQVWRIPLDSIEAASATDESDPASRRTYASERPQELARLIELLDRNSHPFVPISHRISN